MLFSQLQCGALLLCGLLVAAFMPDREVAGEIVALPIGLLFVAIFSLSVLVSIRVLIIGENRDRIRLGIWYALIVTIVLLLVLLDVPNSLTTAIVFTPLVAAAFVLPAVWLKNP